MKISPTAIVCSLSIPVVLIMLGGIWAAAPTRVFCSMSDASMRDARFTLVKPDRLAEPNDDVEWAFAETQARATLVGIVGLISLTGSIVYVLKKGAANQTSELTA